MSETQSGNKVQHFRLRKFLHRHLQYNFLWIEERLFTISNKELRDALTTYLFNIQDGSFPQNEFQSRINPSASILKFVGSREEIVEVDIIKSFFKGELIKYDSNHPLCRYTQNAFKDLESEALYHPQILKYILFNNPDAIAIETPVWKRIISSSQCFTGHVDLILIEDETLKITDYKPRGTSEIIKAIPQFMAYSIMLKEQLEKIGELKNFKIECVGFNNNVAWEFNPENIKNKIIQLVNILNQKRNERLQSKEFYRNAKRTDLKKDLRRLLE